MGGPTVCTGTAEGLADQQACLPALPHYTRCLPGNSDQEQYDSAQEDPKQDEGNITSLLDAELDASSGEETDASRHSCHSLSADRHCQRNRTLWRECNQAYQEFRKPRNQRLSFPLFRETTKEDAISYRDWHSEVEEAFERGYDAAKVKEAMFTSLEGMALDNTKMIDENGNLHVTRILGRLDSLHGVSITFQLLNAALCGLQ